MSSHDNQSHRSRGSMRRRSPSRHPHGRASGAAGTAAPLLGASLLPLAVIVLQGIMIPTGRPFFLLIFWTAVVVMALAQGTLVFVTIRRGRRRGASSQIQTAGPALQVVWALLPMVLLIGLLVLSWPALRTA